MDKEYWNKYYKSFEISTPSLFAQFIVEKYLKKEYRVLELGCGNGRDAYYLAKYAKEVIAVDQVCENIKFKNLEFIQDNFVTLDTKKYGLFNVIYSRFTMHAIKNKEMLNCFDYVKKNLMPGGIFALEARGEKNELFRKGKAHETEKNTFYLDNHFRRFLNKEDTEVKLMERGF